MLLQNVSLIGSSVHLIVIQIESSFLVMKFSTKLEQTVCPLLLKPLKHPKQFLGMITYKRGMKCHEFIVNVNQKTNASHFHPLPSQYLRFFSKVVRALFSEPSSNMPAFCNIISHTQHETGIYYY